jgi:hypothetical protein
MSSTEKDSLPPSYTDSIPLPPSLLTHLSQTRTTHIHSTVTTHILPVISHHASLGIASTTIALLPSDTPLPAVAENPDFTFDTSNTKAVEVVGFSSGEEPNVIRLEGVMNRTEFWRVHAVVEELEKTLSKRLNGDVEVERVQEAVRHQRQPQRTFLSRIIPSLKLERRSPGGNPEVGVRQNSATVGSVVVKARVEEICLRTVSEFGLYETMAKQCVVVKVDARL